MIEQLPPEILAVAPELATVRWSQEAAASCGACPMQEAHGGAHGNRRAFKARVRCCTYHPRLANYAVGRVLRRGDTGARQMLKRLKNPDGVGPRGVGPDRPSAELYEARSNDQFGNMALVCPYWVEGPFGCSIHADRNPVCRTWFCKHMEGERGWHVWMKAKSVLQWIEDRLTEAPLRDAPAPAEGADRDEWIAWYLYCAAWVDEHGGEHLRASRDAEWERRLKGLREAVSARDEALPDVVGAQVFDWEIVGEVVRMTAYSNYDTHDLPRHVFVLFSKLDGKRPWREALGLAEAELGGPIGEDLVRLLWTQGLLQAPQDGDYDAPAGGRVTILAPEAV